jgi:uncharacterized OsmC-like protein
MDQAPAKMTFHVEAVRVDAHGSFARCKNAEITLDTDLAGHPDAFNPPELLLAALSACMIKGIERVAPILQFQLRGVEVRVDGVRQDVPPKMESIRYEIIVDTDASDQRLALLHQTMKNYGTVSTPWCQVSISWASCGVGKLANESGARSCSAQDRCLPSPRGFRRADPVRRSRPRRPPC